MLDGLFALLEHGLMDALAEHIDPTRIGNRHPSIAPFDAFNCQDRMLVICCGTDALFQCLCDTLGLSNLKSDDRFATNEKRSENQAALKTELEMALKQDIAQVWCGKLENAGIPVGLVQTVEEAENMEQIRVRNMIIDLGGRALPGNPMKFGTYDSIPATALPPTLDQDGGKLRDEFKGP